MDDGSGVFGALAAMWVVMMLFSLAMLAFTIYLYVRVARKAGYPPGYGALMLVPVVNIVVMIMFVFSEWPVEAENRALRARTGAVGVGNQWQTPPPAPPRTGHPGQY